ncbi:MAG: ATP-dependent DNA helicase RecG [Planctomycetota bacterium]|nr:ATP-dependent DNA helicase RecG [Planctomycetota bacterium]
MPARPPAAEAAGERLARSLQYFKGVGPKRYELLERLLLRRVEDLLHFWPVDHKDRASLTPLARLRPGQEANVRAQVVDVQAKILYRAGKHRVEALLHDESGDGFAVWWSPYVLEKLDPGTWCFFSGKVVANKQGGVELSHPEFEILGKEDLGADLLTGAPAGEAARPAPPSTSEHPDFGRIVPVYSLRPRQRRPDGTEPPEVKLSQSVLRKLIWQALACGAPDDLAEALPEGLRGKRGLPPLPEAVRQFHFPKSFESRDRARRRLAYEELFMLALGMGLRREQVARRQTARKLPMGPNVRKRIEARLPFELTEAQRAALEEIAADLAQARPMNRLLQGDVGCGKTAVAVSAMLLAVAHGAQAALLAPTEVLAEQHARTLADLLKGSRVNVSLLRGQRAKKEREVFLAHLASGDLHIAVGTHALLGEDVKFKNLALVVVDEQHKFGVRQRMALRAKGAAPHVLVMTATPIPRTLGLTLYSDLDVTTITGFPPGRGEVVTRWVKEKDRTKVYELLIAEARKGHAAYVVLPRIEGDGIESEGGTGEKLWSEVKGVEDERKRLARHLPSLRIEALHGRMKAEEKDAVLARLREGRLDVLVSTLVVEVGIDLPTATVMLIENAERFGLAGLHQLRGRVGRSGLKSWCFFFGEAKTKDARERLKAFAKIKDGFEIAEEDFRLRGPGQFFGTEQSGLPELAVADLARDREILLHARDDAAELLKRDPDLRKPEYAELRRRIRRDFAQRLGLVDMG